MFLPAEMDALVADGGGLAGLRAARVPVPRPGRGQVLVEMRAAPCNPADLLYLDGRYGITRPFPATPGFEGAGVVVASGGGLLARWLVGRRVACGGHGCTGTWATYCVADANQCIPLRSALSFDEGATALSNPMTALALVALMRGGGHRAYVQTAAAGQLGRMIRSVARRHGLAGIHVVRRAAQADSLRKLGARDVLVSADAGFSAQLAARCREKGASVALDAVAGAMTGQLAAALGPRGEVVVYGALSGDPCGGIDPMALCFGAKRVRGFELVGHLRTLGLLGKIRLGLAAQALVVSGEVATAVRARLALAEAPAALAEYEKSMSEGKVLLLPR